MKTQHPDDHSEHIRWQVPGCLWPETSKMIEGHKILRSREKQEGEGGGRNRKAAFSTWRAEKRVIKSPSLTRRVMSASDQFLGPGTLPTLHFGEESQQWVSGMSEESLKEAEGTSRDIKHWGKGRRRCSRARGGEWGGLDPCWRWEELRRVHRSPECCGL